MPIKDLIKRREYHRLYIKNVWYPKNKKKHREYVNKGKIALKRYIAGIKDVPCVDCGNKYPSFVMEFDHMRGKKIGTVSNMVVYGYSRRAKEEIKKCEIVCANCHRLRTYRRKGFVV
jgi:hypothetical protein